MPASPPGPLWKRLVWFIALWFTGLATVAALAWVLRLWIG